MFTIHRFVVIGTLLLSLLLLSPVYAESACKGLGKSACGSKSSCTWVDGYTRKDGKKVSAYCRSVGKKSTKASSKDKKTVSNKAAKDTSSKKTTDKKKSKEESKKKPNKEAKKETKKSS